MRRWIFLFSFLLVIVLGVLLATLWIFNTTEGTRWLMRTISRFTSVEIEAREVRGQLGNKLQLEKIQIHWPQGKIKADLVEIHWNPLLLLLRRVEVKNLVLEGIRIEDHRGVSETPFEFQWPRVPGVLFWINGKIKNCMVKEFSYHRRSERSLFIESFRGHLQWRDGILVGEEMEMDAPLLKVKGNIEMGLLRPTLYLRLEVFPSKQIMDIDNLYLNSRILQGRIPNQMWGNIFVEGRSGSIKKISLEGEIGFSPKSLFFRDLRLSRPDRPGKWIGEGQILFSTKRIFLKLNSHFMELDLSRELGLPAQFSGTLAFEGSPSDYRGEIHVKSSEGKWYSGNLSGKFNGSLEGAHFQFLEGRLLDGRFKGALAIHWKEGFSIKGSLQANTLNPARITSEWEGSINLDIEGDLRFPSKESPQGRILARFRESHFKGHSLQGDLELSFKNSMFHIQQAKFKGKGFTLTANGVLQEKIQFHAEISDLSTLVPGGGGEFSAKGWGRWSKGLWSVKFEGEGKALALKEIKAKKIGLWAQINEEGKRIFQIKGSFHQVQYQSLKLDSLHVKGEGSLSEHHINILIHSPIESVETSIEGGFTENAWRGRLIHLEGKDIHGWWKMEAPTSFSISSHRIWMEPLLLISSYKERLIFSIDLKRHPLKGICQARWDQFKLERLNPWVGKFHLSGHTNGDLELQWIEKGGIKINGEVDVRGGFFYPSLRMDVTKANLKFNWDEKKLDAMATLELPPEGRFHVLLTSEQPARLSFPKPIKIDARWEDIDTSIFRSYFPRGVSIEGKLSGHLLTQWVRDSRFDHEGWIKLSQGILKWPHREGQKMAEVKTLNLNWTWQKDSVKGRLSWALADYGFFRGNFEFPIAPQWPPTIQPKNPLRIALSGELRDRGLMSSFFPELIKDSRVQMEMNLEAMGTWERPNLRALLELKNSEVSLNLSKENRSPPPLTIELSRGQIKLNWDEKGLFTLCHLEFNRAGRFKINLSSSQPARMGIPSRGKVEATWEGSGLSLLSPWLPAGLLMEAEWLGTLSGEWSDGRFESRGGIKISSGKITWRHEGGNIKAYLKSADLDWNWRGDRLRGEISFALQEYGYLKGNVDLPLPARFPIAIQPDGLLKLSLEGEFREKGILPAFLPGLVQESQGQLHICLSGDGSWKNPDLKGNIQLKNIEASIPGLGIWLKEVRMEAKLKKDDVRITSFQAYSGEGQVGGEATIQIKDWKVSHFQGRLQGERFKTIHLPELQVWSSPKIEFHGTPQKLFVRGEVRLPEVIITGPPTREGIGPSSDVVILDAPEVSKKGFPLSPDIQIQVLLGEKVFVKSYGIEARLVGGLFIKFQDPRKIDAEGEIRVARGHYEAYGQRLEIIRGRLIFTGGPVENPTVDALAVRKIEEIQAGVVISGSLKKPIVKLYSRPAMPDTDVLSYIILGRPLGHGTEAVPSLMQAAAALLSAGESVVLQGRLKKLLGLDTLDITTPSGEGEVTRSMVTVGKYLTPKLYISLGRSLYADSTLLMLRYTLSKRLELQATTGTESGATLFYKIEFK